MQTYRVRLAIAVAASVLPNLAWAQHEAHQAGAKPASTTELAQCVRAQPAIENIVKGAMARLEAARLSNSATEMRAAVDHLEAALRDIRAQLTPCATAAASTDSHAGQTMPTSPSPAADAHAGHAAQSTSPAKKPPPPAGKPGDERTADPHAGHSSTQPSDKQMDPVNGLMVDRATAPTATYRGQTYYFSSEQSKKEFLANPAKFAKKPKG